MVAAKRARQPTWYPWALVALFSAASVAFNILHALDRYLTAARWVRPLEFAMPPIALVLATHLLLQQGAGCSFASSALRPAEVAPVSRPKTANRPLLNPALAHATRGFRVPAAPPSRPGPRPAAARGDRLLLCDPGCGLVGKHPAPAR